MKKAHFMGLFGAATLSIAASAWAGYWSNHIKLANLDTATDGYVVFPDASTPLNNPGNCANTSRAVGYASSSAADKDLMNRTLLAAFLANRKVKLNVASSVCSSAGYPVYLQVSLDADQ